MIVVDTSVWVPVLRGTGAPADVKALGELIEADEVVLAWPVRQELRAGVAARHRKGLLAALSGLPVALPSEDTWRTVERWTDQAAASGERFGVADLLIGALASELGALVWSYDGDFARMAHLKLVQLYG